MKFTSFTIAGLLMAGAAFAASKEKAQEYVDRTAELTDYEEVAQMTSEQIIDQFGTIGLQLNGEKSAEAQDILNEALLEALPSAVQSTVPIVAEVWSLMRRWNFSTRLKVRHFFPNQGFLV